MCILINSIVILSERFGEIICNQFRIVYLCMYDKSHHSLQYGMLIYRCNVSLGHVYSRQVCLFFSDISFAFRKSVGARGGTQLGASVPLYECMRRALVSCTHTHANACMPPCELLTATGGRYCVATLAGRMFSCSPSVIIISGSIIFIFAIR